MNYYKVEISRDIKSVLSDIDIEQYIVGHESWKFSVFISYFNDVEVLDKKWKQVSDVIATCYQSQLKGQDHLFEKWNVYVVYLTRNKVDKSLKASIENDKFSCRKIVVDNRYSIPNGEILKDIITKYITHTDLIDVVKRTKKIVEKDYISSNIQVWNLIPLDKSLSRDYNLQDNIFEQLMSIEDED